MDVQLPNGVIVKNVPPGTTKAMLSARLNKSGTAPSPQVTPPPANDKSGGILDTVVRGAANAATFNMADEIAAGADALLQPVFGTGRSGKSLGERYDQNLVDQRERDKANAAANPATDIAANIGGAVAGPGKFAAVPKGIIGLLKRGAVEGGIYGFGSGEGGLENRVKSAATGSAIGLGTGAAFGGAVKAFDKVRPGNVAARYVNDQFAKSPMGAESQRIGNEIGQTYTPGQATGSRGLLTIEGLVRRHPSSADRMAEFDTKQLDTSLRNLNANLDRLATNPAGPEATGNLVSKSFDTVLSKARTVRRATANADFGRVDEIAGKGKVIQPDNLRTQIDSLVDDFSAPGGGDASAALVGQAERLRNALSKDGLSAKETERLLEIYGKAANGTGAVFKDMDTGQQRYIAGRLRDALVADLDAAADAGGHSGQVATALKTARDNYRSNSAAINDLEKSVLGRLFGGDYDKSPERVAQAVKNMRPTELRQSLDILNKADPQTSQTVKRYLVEDAMSNAGVNPASGAPQPQIAGEATFSPAKFLTSIRKSPVWGSFDATERKNMETAVRDLERVAFRAGTDGSPTAPLQAALGILSRPAGQVAGGAALGGGLAAVSGGDVKEGAFAGATAGGLGGAAIPRIAKLITSPEGQRALRTVRTAKPNSRAAAAATAVLVGLIAPKDAERAPEAGGAP